MGKCNVTLRDISEKTGFSKFTVSNALHSNREQVSEDTMNLIKKVAREMGYNPAVAYQARRLSLQRNGRHVQNQVVGLFFPINRLDRAYFREFLCGVTDRLYKDSFNLLINCGSTNQKVEDMMPMLARGEVDGLIVVANMKWFQNRPYPELRSLPGFGNRPVVTAIDPLDGCSSVLSDDESGAFDAVSHLLKLGHRRILHFWNDPCGDNTMERRLRGAAAACRKRGMSPDSVLTKAAGWSQGDRAKTFGYIRDAFDEHPDITAIAAPNDPAAIDIVEHLSQLGLCVPGDVSLIGFDDTDPLWNENHENILTTVRVPLYDIGFAVAEMVVRLSDKKDFDNERLILPTKLLQRSTTAKFREEV